MKAFVTGAGGFIGSHLVEFLTKQGAEVRALVRYNSSSDLGNLKYISKDVRASIEIVQGDLRDPDAMHRGVAGCSHVFHLGALIAIPYSYQNPNEFVQTNVQGTANVLNASLRNNTIERVVVTSTSEVYGTAQYVPIDEKHPIQGQSPYSATKIGADAIAESYFRAFDLPVGILRPFNTFGPRQSLRAIIPTIISQLLYSDTIKLGALDPRRDLTFVGDTVRGFYMLGTHPNAPLGQPLNIGNGSDISIGELLERLKILTGSQATLEYDPQRMRPEKSEVLRLLCDYSVAKELIGWEPLMSLDDGLLATIEWVKQQYAQADVGHYHV